MLLILLGVVVPLDKVGLAEGSIGPVKVDSAMRAAAWCEYLACHARRVYGLVEVGKINTARTLGQRIAEGKLNDQFTARDVWKKGWTGIRSTADAEAALAVLEDYGWVQSFEVYDQPGRPTIHFNINPKQGSQRDGLGRAGQGPCFAKGRGGNTQNPRNFDFGGYGGTHPACT